MARLNTPRLQSDCMVVRRAQPVFATKEGSRCVMSRPSFGQFQIHVPVPVLWKHSKNSEPLSTEQREHLKRCEHCVAILWACRSSTSFEQLGERLKEHGMDAE